MAIDNEGVIPNANLSAAQGESSSSVITKTTTMSLQQARTVRQQTRSLTKRQSSKGSASHAHGHGSSEKSIITAVAAAVINYLLMFGLCCAYGMIMFYDPHNRQHVGLGVKMNLSTAMLCGLLLAWQSKVPVAIGGPDLNPVVFIGGFVETISYEIAKEQSFSDYPDAGKRRLGGGGGSSASWFCSGEHLATHEDECGAYHDSLAATVIFAVAVSSAILGSVFLLLGRFRLTRLVSYVPTSVMEAFLSCVGYKVFKYALKFCDYELRQFVPAACVGVPLYFLKANHVGNPAVVMPLGLLLPLALFYIVCYGVGSDIDSARADNFFFPKLPDVDFWEIWTKSIGNYEMISIKAWTATIPDLVIMVIVCTLDCLLKISSTETKLPVKCDKDYEIQLHGISNVATVACGSTVGYMQLKFNVINFGVMDNTKDRRGGFMYAILCGISFFGPIQHFDYLPRMFLAALLFFAGSGFVAENLWGSRKFLSFPEWMEILIILGIFILTGSLLYAVVAGGFITGVSFIIKYAKLPAFHGKPLTGAEVATREHYDEQHKLAMRHILGSWVRIVKLKGFLFFASANSLTGYLMRIIEYEEANQYPRYKRLRYIVLECSLLDGMDASAAKSLQKFSEDLHVHRVLIMWTAVKPVLNKEMVTRGVIGNANNKDDLLLPNTETAVLMVEQEVTAYLLKMQTVCLRLHPSFHKYHKLWEEKSARDPFAAVLLQDAARHGCPWQFCSTVKLSTDQILWSSDEDHKQLYLVHSGAVGFFLKNPAECSVDSDGVAAFRPLAIFRTGRFINHEFLLGAAQRYTAVVLEDGEALQWTEDQLHTMKRKNSSMHAALQKHAILQAVEDAEVAAERAGSNHAEDAKLEATEYRGFADFAVRKPMLLQETLNMIGSAGALGDRGFYNAVKEVENHPEMPHKMYDDVEIAFKTFGKHDDAGNMLLPPDELRAALNYAGIYHSYIRRAKSSLSWIQFRQLANEVAMVPFSHQHVNDINKIFDEQDVDNSQSLEEGELAMVFRRAMGREISVDMLDGIASLFQDKQTSAIDGEVCVDLAQFTAIMSRYLRKHESYWHLLRGMREVFDNEQLIDNGYVTVAQLLGKRQMVDFATEDHTEREIAEEFVWAADWTGQRNKKEGGEAELSMVCMLTLMNLQLEPKNQPLPPKPRLEWSDPVSYTTNYKDAIAKALDRQPDSEDQLSTSTGQKISFKVLDESHGDELKAFFPIRIRQEKQFDHSDKEKQYLDYRSSKRTSVTGQLDRVTSGSDCGQVDDATKGLIVDDRDDQDFNGFDEEEDIGGPKAPGGIATMADVMANPAHLFMDIHAYRSSPNLPDATKPIRFRLYTILEDPDTSRAAAIWSATMGVLIMVAVLTLVAQPLLEDVIEEGFWNVMEAFFAIVFSIEYGLRLYVCPEAGQVTTEPKLLSADKAEDEPVQSLPDAESYRAKFIFQPGNVCDLLAIIPTVMDWALGAKSKEMRLLRVVRLLRLSRMARVARLAKNWPLAAPVSMVLVVIWGIYMKSGLS